ncbi:hypothetical protein A9Q83_04300 [Alphaproteobacteria bacterium 46_93_T64]|nr:hypothetical protein A9Q83_04300 [Alphaproteobacteria bacterium 46_93_T64]
MKKLTDVSWKSVYRSGNDNILNDFYKPLLSHCKQYDRAVGYFSSELFLHNLAGISSIVQNNGKMRLVIGHPLSEMEFRAIHHGNELSRMLEKLSDRLLEIIEEVRGKAVDRFELLAWLIAANKLEIKFALRRQGMYHEKIGIAYDSDDNIVVFQGSANETFYAMNDSYNAESLMVFPSWESDVFKKYGEPCITSFLELWEGRQKNTITVDVPSNFYSMIAKRYSLDNPVTPEFEEQDVPRAELFFAETIVTSEPGVPNEIGGRQFELFDHQNKAISNWWSNNAHKGILKLATGAGKTITSIYAAVKIFEAKKEKEQPLFLIISVPYVELANQWIEDLKNFNIFPHRCFGSKRNWVDNLKKDIFSFRMEAISFVATVVVNKTLGTDDFSRLICDIAPENLMFIGDECHNHGSSRIQQYLPNADFRMGLSATPYRSDDDEVDSPFPNDAKLRIESYYSGIAFEYSLSDAINDRILCEYKYHIVPVFLTAEEQEVFEELSTAISKIIAKKFSSKLNKIEQENLTILCSKRSRLLGTASNKLVELGKLVNTIEPEHRNLSLFYCGEGRVFNADEVGDDERVVEKVSQVLGNNGWKTSRFTSNESPAERKSIMSSFKSKGIDALVSMKVLDEGIDVPSCNTAFILASTKNPRQYIQRRGRVLRRSSGKKYAVIYDFVVLPIDGIDSVAATKLKESEMERVEDFTALAINKYEIENIINELGLRDV